MQKIKTQAARMADANMDGIGCWSNGGFQSVNGVVVQYSKKRETKYYKNRRGQTVKTEYISK